MTGADLSFIHRFVPAARPGAPTLLLLHGTGGDEEDLLELGSALWSGAGYLSPRGKVLENGMPRFFRRLEPGVFDLQDLELRTRELADFVTAAAGIYGFDPGRVVAVGYSNGANIAANLVLTHPGVLAGAVLLHALLPQEPSEPPKLSGLPVFLSGGLADAMISPAQTERLATVLEEAGATVKLHWAPGGHSLSAGEMATARAWLATAFPADAYTEA
jgi:phospholipase/carboxylesterase/glyoxalase family protein